MESAEISIEVVEPEAPESPLERALGGFRVVRLIGKGAMGEVHLAEHRVIGSRVAVKFLRPELAGKLHLVEQFYEEARAANRVGHPGIVKVFDLKFVPPDCYFLVMEYLEGRPLSRLIGAPVPTRTAVPLLAQTCDALDAVHRAGLVHQDIKPDNIFLVPRGRAEVPRLLDFGAARLRAVPVPAGPKGRTVVGTPAYMPLEQWRAEGVDGRTDLYALGMVAYQLATGAHPFQDVGGTPKEAFCAHRDRTPADPRELHPGVPDALAEAILRAIARRPEDRFSSAAELARALRRVLAAAPRKRRARGGAAAAVPTPTLTISISSTSLPEPAAPAHGCGEPGTLQLDAEVWRTSFRAFATVSTSARPATLEPRHAGEEPAPPPG